jgi:hypothetical protein
MPGAVVTLQVGNFANYVGAHFWNLQARVIFQQLRGQACLTIADVAGLCNTRMKPLVTKQKRAGKASLLL